MIKVQLFNETRVIFDTKSRYIEVLRSSMLFIKNPVNFWQGIEHSLQALLPTTNDLSISEMRIL